MVRASAVSCRGAGGEAELGHGGASRLVHASSSWQWARIWRWVMRPFWRVALAAKRRCWMAMAATTLSRIWPLEVPGVLAESSRKGTAGTSMWMSMRSRLVKPVKNVVAVGTCSSDSTCSSFLQMQAGQLVLCESLICGCGEPESRAAYPRQAIRPVRLTQDEARID